MSGFAQSFLLLLSSPRVQPAEVDSDVLPMCSECQTVEFVHNPVTIHGSWQFGMVVSTLTMMVEGCDKIQKIAQHLVVNMK